MYQLPVLQEVLNSISTLCDKFSTSTCVMIHMLFRLFVHWYTNTIFHSSNLLTISLLNVRSTRDNSPSWTNYIRVDGPRIYWLQVDYARSNLNLYKTYRNETRFPIYTSSFIIFSKTSFIHSLHTLMFNINWT